MSHELSPVTVGQTEEYTIDELKEMIAKLGNPDSGIEQKFFIQGRDVMVGELDNKTILDNLPTAVYEVRQSIAGLYLHRLDGFKLPSKIYGDVKSRTMRVLSTFTQNKRSMGVLLRGDKGSGKTLLAEQVCTTAMETLEMPIIMVTKAYNGMMFNNFIKSIKQPCVVFFDEFDKTHGKGKGDDGNEASNHLLTLLDGAFSSNKLYLLTCNESSKVNDYLTARPGRIHYVWTYSGITDEAIKEYCADALDNQDYLKQILAISKVTQPFTFDILRAIVNESNLYSEPPEKFVGFLNVGDTGKDQDASYEVSVQINGVQVEDKRIPQSIMYTNISEAFYVSMKCFPKTVKSPDREGKDAYAFLRNFNITVNPENDMRDIQEDGTRIFEVDITANADGYDMEDIEDFQFTADDVPSEKGEKRKLIATINMKPRTKTRRRSFGLAF